MDNWSLYFTTMNSLGKIGNPNKSFRIIDAEQETHPKKGRKTSTRSKRNKKSKRHKLNYKFYYYLIVSSSWYHTLSCPEGKQQSEV